MMTKRSNHMPTLMRIDATNIAGMLRRIFLNQKICGTITLHDIISVHAHQNGPAMRAWKKWYASYSIARVPGDEELHPVRVANEAARHEDDLVHQLEVLDRDEALHPVDGARDERERHDHREAAEDGAGDEVRREDRRVPAGDDRRGEVERNDRVDGEDQRRRERGEDQVRALVVLPVAVRAAPAEREEAVDELARSSSWRDRAGSRSPG